MVQGDLGSGNVVLKPREGEKPEEKVGFGMLEIHVCVHIYIYMYIYIYIYIYVHIHVYACTYTNIQ